MHLRRSANFIARFVLVWFALSLGVATASPLVKPQATTLICSGTGVMKLLVQNDDGSGTEIVARMLDCPLCASVNAPLPASKQDVEHAQPLGYIFQTIPAAYIAELIAALPPARGPPSFS